MSGSEHFRIGKLREKKKPRVLKYLQSLILRGKQTHRVILESSFVLGFRMQIRRGRDEIADNAAVELRVAAQKERTTTSNGGSIDLQMKLHNYSTTELR